MWWFRFGDVSSPAREERREKRGGKKKKKNLLVVFRSARFFFWGGWRGAAKHKSNSHKSKNWLFVRSLHGMWVREESLRPNLLNRTSGPALTRPGSGVGQINGQLLNKWGETESTRETKKS